MAEWFFRNPRFLLLALGLIIVAGGSSYAVLPRMEDPQMRERAANVYTVFPGADAERVETLVSEKIEDSLREVDEIKRIRSFSRTGISLISIELRDEVTEPEPIWSRIRDKVDDVRPELPAGCLDPEFDQLDIKAYATLIAVVWRSEDPVSYAVLRRQAEQLEEVIKAISGTEKVDRFGDPGESIHVDIDSNRAVSIGLTAADIARQIAASDAKDAAGQIRNSRSSVILQVDEEIDTLHRLSEIPIRYAAEGTFVPLSDLATIEKGTADPMPTMAIIDGRPAVVLGVMARSDIRIDLWRERLNTEVNRFQDGMGSGLSIDWLYDQSRYVSERLNSVIFNLLTGATAVFFVVLLMMGLRSALIVSMALPLSALIVIAGLRFQGIPIHQMSITGLIIALGLLIDNAIIIVDSVSHRIRHQESPLSAIKNSMRQLALPLAGSTVTTALAFAPLALMPGPAGEFVGSIAFSVILAIFSSLLLSLTIVPAVTALWSPRNQETESANWLQAGISLAVVSRAFEHFLRAILKRPWLGVVGGLILPILGFLAATQLSEQFFPAADRDQFSIDIELPTGSSIERTETFAKLLRERLLQEPRVVATHWFIGESAPTFYYNLIPRRKATPNYAQALIQLDSAYQLRTLIRRLQQEFDQEYPEARILVRQLEQGPPFDAPVEIRLFGQDLETLREKGEELRQIASGIPNVIHTAAELSEVQPKLSLSVDEERARWLGLDHGAIAGQLRNDLDGVPGGTILEGTEEVPVRVRVAGSGRSDFDGVGGLEFVASPRGDALTPASSAGSFSGVPLTSIAHVDLTSDLAAINHYDGRRMNEIKVYLQAGVLPSTVLAEFERRIKENKLQLPPGYSLTFGGEAAERDQAVGGLMANVGVLVVLMIASLVLSFRSYRNAGLVGVVGIMSLGLGMGSLWVFGYPFGFMSIVGAMGLVGVAINDSIVVLAGLEENPEASRGDREAIIQVVMGSSRHVLSTTLTTIAGFVPLVLSGGGFWPPLAVAISGGVGGATLLALFFIPAAYRLTAGRQREEAASEIA